MEFRILGALEAVAGGGALSLGSSQQRAVLALLLVNAPEPVSRDRVIDELWGERPPASAEHAVQVYVSGLRKVLRAGGEVVSVRSSAAGYVLDVDPESVDANRFQRLASEALRALQDDPARAQTLFEEALGLWRGAPLSELGAFEFVRREADRLDELHTAAVEGLVEARLACGEHGEAIAQLTRLVSENPLRERPRRLLMLALYRAGRHAEALAAYRDACQALDEIGLQPGPELRALEEAILRHDPSLRAESPSAEVATADAGAAGAVRATPLIDARALPTTGTVTLLFTDIERSTQLLDRLGGQYPTALSEHHRVMREAIAATEGYELVVAGDSFLVAFAEAAAAVDCAARVQRAFGRTQWPRGEAVRVRIGVHTGAPVVRDGTYVGMDVHRAARVMAVAYGGQVLLTHEAVRALGTSQQVRDLGFHRLKDLPAPEHLFQLLARGLRASSRACAR